MKRYKEELERFHLQDEQRQILKAAMIKETKQHKQRHKAVFAMTCICILIGAFSIVLSQYAHLPHAVLSSVRGLKEQSDQWHQHTPQEYEFLGGFGMTLGVIQSETMEEAGNSYPKVETLPVYEYKQSDPLSAKTATLSQEECHARISDMKRRLSMKEDIETTGIEFQVSNEVMTLSIRDDGVMELFMKQEIKSNQHNSNDILTWAKQYTKLYQQIALITDPVYHISESFTGSYEVIITQAKDWLPIYEEGKNALIFSIREGHAIITIPDKSQLKDLGEYQVIDVQEAKKELLNGNYYYAIANTDFHEDDIIGYDMTYPNLPGVRTFLPYRLPVYRFYIKKSEGIYKFDVVAVEGDFPVT